MKKIKIGDIMVFKSSRPDPIIHRVIEKNVKVGQVLVRTKGDHNLMSIETKGLNESEIGKDRYIGRAVFRIPYLGWIKIGFVRLVDVFKSMGG